MNLFTIDIILNFSIVIAAITGIFRFTLILKNFYPLIIFIWIGLGNELLSLVLIKQTGANAVNSNIYVLVEFVILLWQFYTWNNNYLQKCIVAGATGILVWMADNFLLHSIAGNNSIFRIYYSLVVVLFSIDLINRAIINEKRNILRNAIFLACSGFLMYYGIKALLEVFNSFNINFDNTFYIKIWLTLSGANCLANLTYALSILCIPKKQEFYLHY